MPAELVASTPNDLPGRRPARRLAHHGHHQRPGRGVRRRAGHRARAARGAAARRQRRRRSGRWTAASSSTSTASPTPTALALLDRLRGAGHRRRWSSWRSTELGVVDVYAVGLQRTTRADAGHGDGLRRGGAPRPRGRGAQGAARVRRGAQPQGVHARPARTRPRGHARRATSTPGSTATRPSGSWRRTGRCRRCSHWARRGTPALVELLRDTRAVAPVAPSGCADLPTASARRPARARRRPARRRGPRRPRRRAARRDAATRSRSRRWCPGLEVETMSYGRIGERGVRRLRERDDPLVAVGARPDGPGWAAVHLTAEAQERLGGPAWFDRGRRGRPGRRRSTRSTASPAGTSSAQLLEAAAMSVHEAAAPRAARRAWSSTRPPTSCAGAARDGALRETGLHDYAALYAVPGPVRGGRTTCTWRAARRACSRSALADAVPEPDRAGPPGARRRGRHRSGRRGAGRRRLPPARRHRPRAGQRGRAAARPARGLRPTPAPMDLAAPDPRRRGAGWRRSRPTSSPSRGAVGYGHLPVEALRAAHPPAAGRAACWPLTAAPDLGTAPELAAHAALLLGPAYRAGAPPRGRAPAQRAAAPLRRRSPSCSRRTGRTRDARCATPTTPTAWRTTGSTTRCPSSPTPATAGVALTLDVHHLDPLADDALAQAERLRARLDALCLEVVVETGARYLLDPRVKHEPTLVTPDARGPGPPAGLPAPRLRPRRGAARRGGELLGRRAARRRRPRARRGAGCVDGVAGARRQRTGTRRTRWPSSPSRGCSSRTATTGRGCRAQVPRSDARARHRPLRRERRVRAGGGRARVRAAPRHRRGRGHAPRRARPPAARRGRRRPARGARRAASTSATTGWSRWSCPATATARTRWCRGRWRRSRCRGAGRGGMRVCFVSRRYWPAVSGMSVYAENLLRELVALGPRRHAGQPVPRRRGRHPRSTAAARPRRTGCPAGVRVVALASRGETVVPADFEGDVAELADTVVRAARASSRSTCCTRSTATRPGSRCCWPPGATGLPTRREHPGRRRALGRHLLHARTRPRSRPCSTTPAPCSSAAPSFRDEVVGHHGTDPARFTIVPGATDTARFTPGEPPARCGPAGAAVPRPRRPPQGRARPARGAARRGPAGGLRHRARTSTRPRARADGRTTFLGYTAAGRTRRRSTARADVFVSPTYSEGFSNTILEAMASGLPVVSTAASASSTACATARTACCTSPATSPGLRAALEPAARRRRAARRGSPPPRSRRCAGCYSWPVLAPQHRRGLPQAGRHGPGPGLVAARRRRPVLPVPRRGAPAVSAVRVLAVSPHLDDAAFSVGGTLAALADAGHEVTVVTCFTRSVPDPTGFALACQTDKGLGARGRLHGAAPRRGPRARWPCSAPRPLHLDLPEAPHRGYDSAPDLFAGVRAGDEVWRDVAGALDDLSTPTCGWRPQGLGGHVDHLQVLRAVAGLRPCRCCGGGTARTSCATRGATPGPDLPAGLAPVELPQDRARRADACACYATPARLPVRRPGADARGAGRPGRAAAGRPAPPWPCCRRLAARPARRPRGSRAACLRGRAPRVPPSSSRTPTPAAAAAPSTASATCWRTCRPTSRVHVVGPTRRSCGWLAARRPGAARARRRRRPRPPPGCCARCAPTSCTSTAARPWAGAAGTAAALALPRRPGHRRRPAAAAHGRPCRCCCAPARSRRASTPPSRWARPAPAGWRTSTRSGAAACARSPTTCPTPARRRAAAAATGPLRVGRRRPARRRQGPRRAAARASPRCPASSWTCSARAGGARARALVADLGLDDRVRLPGWSEDVGAALPAYDVLVLPRRSEGWPLSIVEAMLAGLPVVATPVGSVAEAVERRARPGCWCRAATSRALAAALRRLRDEPGLGPRLGAGGREVGGRRDDRAADGGGVAGAVAGAARARARAAAAPGAAPLSRCGGAALRMGPCLPLSSTTSGPRAGPARGRRPHHPDGGLAAAVAAGRRPGAAQVREPAAHRVVQDARGVRPDRPPDRRRSGPAASSRPAPATTRRASRSPPSCSGRTATVFMPEAAPLPKVAATKAYGAQVRLSGTTVDEALVAAREFAAQTGAVLIHPFDHAGRHRRAGHRRPGDPRAVPRRARPSSSCTGGGGLLAGIAVAVQGAAAGRRRWSARRRRARPRSRARWPPAAPSRSAP